MIQANNVQGRLALDGRGLDALRLQAKQNPDQALKAVSQQFESVFLHTLLKSMRDATPQDGLMDSNRTHRLPALGCRQSA